MNIGINELVFLDKGITSNIDHPGLMSFAAAFNFTFLGLSYLFIDFKLNKWLYQVFLCLIFPLSLVSLLIYLFNIDRSLIGTYYSNMALHTVLLFMFLCLGTFMVRPEIGLAKIVLMNNIGGRFMRRVLPLALIIPVIIVFLVNLGITYNLYNPILSNVLIAVIMTCVTGFIIFINTNIISNEEGLLDALNRTLFKKEMRFRKFSENVEDVIWQTSPDFENVLYINQAVNKTWGLTLENIYRNPSAWLDAIHPDDQQSVRKEFFKKLLEKSKANVRYRIIRPNGMIRHIYHKGFLLKDHEGNIDSISNIATDVTEIWETAQEDQVIRNVNNILDAKLDTAYTITKILQLISTTFGWDCGQIWLLRHDTKSFDNVYNWYNPKQSSSPMYDMTKIIFFTSGKSLPEKVYQKKNFCWMPEINQHHGMKRGKLAVELGLNSLVANAIIFHDKTYGVMAFFSSNIQKPNAFNIQLISKIGNIIGELIAQKQLLKALDELARVDKLTGLANRSCMEDQMQVMINSMQNSNAALIVITIVSYEVICDALGINAGELLLKLVADRINDHFSRQPCTIARLEYNKFAIFTTYIKSPDAVMKHAKSIFNIFELPFFINGESIFVTANLGIALFPEDTSDIKKLLNYATLASVGQKKNITSQLQFYTKTLSTFKTKKLKLDMRLRNALGNNEFELYYQPQNDLKTGKVVGLEALIRWHDTESTLVAPDAFIPLAEKSGLIISIDEWVLRSVCQTIKEGLIKPYPSIKSVSINISAQHFQKRYNLSSTLHRLTKEFDIDPSCIEIETTEISMLHHHNQTAQMMRKIVDYGFHLVIDDFGSGYSSLKYLLEIPSNKIKIDKAFIDGLPHNSRNIAIIKSIINISHQLNNHVVAEGVERIEQVEFLMQNGCDSIQGFYFTKPLPLDEIKLLLASNKVMQHYKK